MWLVGVVVLRYIDILIIIITFPYSTCISSFFGSSITTSLFILKMFFLSCLLFLCRNNHTLYTQDKEHSRSFKNRDRADRARASTTCEVYTE